MNTIQEAMHYHETYGTVTVIDGDHHALVIYDDDVDVEINYPITIIDY